VEGKREREEGRRERREEGRKERVASLFSLFSSSLYPQVHIARQHPLPVN
jgi:hypothetical protein